MVKCKECLTRHHRKISLQFYNSGTHRFPEGDVPVPEEPPVAGAVHEPGWRLLPGLEVSVPEVEFGQGPLDPLQLHRPLPPLVIV